MKHLIITDPCYLISEKDWQALLHGPTYLLAAITKHFAREGVNCLVVGRTGYGDWNNRVLSADGSVRVAQDEFCADSGMVCVVEQTPRLLAKLKSSVLAGCYALIDVPNDTQATLDCSNPEWSVVVFHSPSKLLLAKTLEAPDADF